MFKINARGEGVEATPPIPRPDVRGAVLKHNIEATCAWCSKRLRFRDLWRVTCNSCGQENSLHVQVYRNL